ncbi:1617_t:CDS:2, partial [Ambispora leptoticha]
RDRDNERGGGEEQPVKFYDIAPNDKTCIQKSGFINIKELRPLFRGFNLNCIILEKIGQKVTMQGQEVFYFLVGDPTAVCTLVVWENGKYFKEGDVIRITNGEVRLYAGKMELTAVKNSGTVKRYDQYCFKFVDSEEPNLSKYDWIEDPDSMEPKTHFIPVYGPDQTPAFPKSEQPPTPSQFLPPSSQQQEQQQNRPSNLPPSSSASQGPPRRNSPHRFNSDSQRPSRRQSAYQPYRKDAMRGIITNRSRLQEPRDYDRRDYDRRDSRDNRNMNSGVGGGRNDFVHRDLDRPEDDQMS